MNMMKTFTFLLVTVAFVAVTGCKPSREKSVAAIKNLEQRLFSHDATGFDKAKSDSLLTLYLDFIKSHPDDSLAHIYLFKAAGLAMNAGDGNKAIGLYDQYIKDYPEGKNAALCLFFKAFIYENMLRNLEKAKETYLLFIELYPENDFVKDAQMAIQNLGKTPDQIVREFEAKKKADSISIADSIAKIKPVKSRRK